MVIIRQSPASTFRLPSIFDGDFWPKFPTKEIRGLNIYETENAVIAEAAVPKIPEDKIDLSLKIVLSELQQLLRKKLKKKSEKAAPKRIQVKKKAA